MNETLMEKLAGRKVLTDVQVAEVYGISKHTLRNMRFRREGPDYLKMSAKAVRYRPEDVEKWLESKRIDLNG